MATIFSKIINGEIPCYKIAENDMFLAFLDIQPIAKGHALVIPKIEIDYFFDLPVEYLSAYNLFAKEVAEKIKKVIPCTKIGISIIGLEVPHAHMHLIPINSVGDMSFTKERINLSPEEFSLLAEEIKKA